jgi:hypothetical protein
MTTISERPGSALSAGDVARAALPASAPLSWLAALPPDLAAAFVARATEVARRRPLLEALAAADAELQVALGSSDILAAVGPLGRVRGLEAVRAVLPPLPEISVAAAEDALAPLGARLLAALNPGQPPSGAVEVLHHRVHPHRAPPRMGDEQARAVETFELLTAAVAEVVRKVRLLLRPLSNAEEVEGRVMGLLGLVPEADAARRVVALFASERERLGPPAPCALCGGAVLTGSAVAAGETWTLERAFRGDVTTRLS